MDFNNYLENKTIEKTLIDNAENTELRKKQVRKTIVNSVKACSDAGKYCDKELLIKEFARLGFPIQRDFILKCLEYVKIRNEIIEKAGLLWIKGSPRDA